MKANQTKAELLKALDEKDVQIETIQKSYSELYQSWEKSINAQENLKTNIFYITELFEELLSNKSIVLNGDTEAQIATRYSKRSALFKRVLSDINKNIQK